MSATETETTVLPSDSSHLVGTPEEATALVKASADTIKSTLGDLRKGDSAARKIQEAIIDLFMIVRTAEGHFCFSTKKQRETATFAELESDLWSQVFPAIPEGPQSAQKQADQDADKQRTENAVKQMVQNGRALESRVTVWAIGQLSAERQAELQAPGALKWAIRPTGSPPILAEVPEDLRAIVAEQCDRDGLTLWKSFGGTRKGGTTKRQDVVRSVLTDLSQVREAVTSGGISAEGVADSLYTLASAAFIRTAEMVDAGDQIPGRDKASVTVANTRDILHVLGLMLAGKATESERNKVAKLLPAPEEKVAA